MTSFIIGVAGGSGSGKSTVTEHIIAAIGSDQVAVLIQDNYYRDLAHFLTESHQNCTASPRRHQQKHKQDSQRQQQQQ